MSRVLVLGAVVALVTLTACADQAPAPCQIQASANGPYVVKFTNTGTATAACPAEFGDGWNFDNFVGGLIAMDSIQVELPNPSDPQGSVYGRGTFSTSDPDADGNCVVTSIEHPFDGPNGSTYNVSNLTFLSTALYIGTEWKADVIYTPAGGPACNYTAQALNPPHACDENANCDPLSQPSNSGINYLYDQGCHMETWATDLAPIVNDYWGTSGAGLCFFNQPYPSLGGFHQ
jgi:hypothetical protein